MARNRRATDRHSYVARCDRHGKRAFTCRADAHAVVRTLRRQGQKGLRTYPCDAVDGNWHIGHIPDVVRKGRLTAPEVFDQEGPTT